MACDKYRIPCDKCDFATQQGICPGVNFWNEICDLPKVGKDRILTKPVNKTFGKLFKSLQKYLPEVNFNNLSSNRVSQLSRKDMMMLLKAIRLKEKELVPQDYVNLKNDNMCRLLYDLMIMIHETRVQ